MLITKARCLRKLFGEIQSHGSLIYADYRRALPWCYLLLRTAKQHAVLMAGAFVPGAIFLTSRGAGSCGFRAALGEDGRGVMSVRASDSDLCCA